MIAMKNKPLKSKIYVINSIFLLRALVVLVAVVGNHRFGATVPLRKYFLKLREPHKTTNTKMWYLVREFTVKTIDKRFLSGRHFVC